MSLCFDVLLGPFSRDLPPSSLRPPRKPKEWRKRETLFLPLFSLICEVHLLSSPFFQRRQFQCSPLREKERKEKEESVAAFPRFIEGGGAEGKKRCFYDWTRRHRKQGAGFTKFVQKMQVPLYSATFLISFYLLNKLSNPMPLLLLPRRRREGVDSAPTVAMHALGLRPLTNTAPAIEASPPRVGS